LEKSVGKKIIFEIDLAFAHSAFREELIKESPYIGHPEEFYTRMGRPFPKDNLTCEAFLEFLEENPSLYVLIDLKDEACFPYLEEFVHKVGASRCLVHAFIKDWTYVPEGIEREPHWYLEDIDLGRLDALLTKIQVPLIANCRCFNDDNIRRHSLLEKMIEDSKNSQSIICLGLYYKGAAFPEIEFLRAINDAGYYAWINANLKERDLLFCSIKYIGMSDEIEDATSMDVLVSPFGG
jgi:hypothetical protein